MQIDHIINQQQQNVIIPNRIEDNPKIAPRPANARPLFQGYYGWGDALFYMWLWGDLCQDQHIHLNDIDLLTERGEMIGSFDAEGLNIGDTNLDLKKRLENISGVNNQNSELFKEEDLGDNLLMDNNSWFDIDNGFDFEGFDF